MREVLTAPRIVTGDETVLDGAVVVLDREVAWVGATVDLPVEYHALTRTSYAACTILPGLIDAHVHLGFDGGPTPVARMQRESDAEQVVLMLRSARELLGVGVTTARDLGSRGYLAIAVRDAIAQDVARGPRMLVAASPVTVTGGHCWYMGGEADSTDELRRIVRLHHKNGADLIKVMATGGFMTVGSAPWYAQFTTAQLAVIVEEAARVDMPVAAHGHGLEGIRRAVEAGVTTVEHCSFVTETNERVFDAALAARMVERGTIVCPTINVNAPYVAKLTGVQVGRWVPVMLEMGVRIIVGTDSGIDNSPHHQYVGGLEYLVDLGVPASRVLAMATTEAAESVGIGKTTGRLAAGYEADLLVVEGDPTTDIRALASLRRVVARGRDYVPDSGRFDVSAPGTPMADPDNALDLRLVQIASRRRPG